MKLLNKYHGLFIAQPVGGAGNQTFELFRDGTRFSAGSNWNKISDPSLNNMFLSATYIDLAGLSVEDETVFFSGAAVQEAGYRTIVQGGSGDQIAIWDILTSIPVDFEALDPSWIYTGLGFPECILNFEHVLYQRKQVWALTSDLTTLAPQLIEETQSGSMLPTASDRIYSYRLIQLGMFSPTMGPPPSGAILVTVPSARHVIQAEAKKEPEYQYLMRLKKSYDLQNEPDVERT